MRRAVDGVIHRPVDRGQILWYILGMGSKPGKRGPQLIRQGLRKCYRCKMVYPLTREFFYRSSTRGANGFKYDCITCTLQARDSYRRKLIEENDFTCQRCGIRYEDFHFFDIDHIKPLAGKRKGKSNYIPQEVDRANLQVLCPNCHRVKTIENRDYLHQREDSDDKKSA